MNAHIGLQEKPTFFLEFHLPFLMLRESRHSEASIKPGHHAGQHYSSRPGYSLRVGDTMYHVSEAHVSVVVCGWSRTKWCAWVFSQTTPEEQQDSEWDNEPEEPPLYEDDECLEFEDFITADGNGTRQDSSESKSMVWDARTYWLRVVQIRMSVINKEWKCLVYSTQEDVKSFVSVSDLSGCGILKV